MITIFVRDCNQISQSFYDSVIFDLQLHQLTCSCSHSACLSVHGYYRRTVTLSSGAIRLRVCRVKCSECGATHALLLSSMVPYSQIPLSDQQRICKDYEEDRDLCMVCEGNPSIDENNVKSILRNYRLCWREKLRSLKIPLFPLFSGRSDPFLFLGLFVAVPSDTPPGQQTFFLYHITLPDSALVAHYNKRKNNKEA